MYTVQFLNRSGKQYDFCELALFPGESLMNKIAEVMFLMLNADPQHSNWKTDLATCGLCMFVDPHYNIVTVEYDWRGGPIVIRDR